MNFDRKSSLILVAVLAILGAVFWNASNERDSGVPPERELPIVQVEMKPDLDQFIEQFRVEPFPSLGLIEAEVFERELIIGWDNRWLSLPQIYRREVLEKIGQPWAYYMGGVTVVYGVPDGSELARYTSEDGSELRGN